MKIFLFVCLILCLPRITLGQEPQISDVRLYLGLSTSYNGQSRLGGLGIEGGMMIDHDDDRSLFFSFIPGAIFHSQKAPHYSSTSTVTFFDSIFPSSQREYTDGPEYFGSVSVGHFFTRRIGLVLSGGLSVESKVLLATRQHFFSSTLISSRTVYHGMGGLEIVYQHRNGDLYRAGYDTHRGFLGGLSFPLSAQKQEIDSTKLIPSFGRVALYLGAGIQRGVSAGMRVHHDDYLTDFSLGYMPNVKLVTNSLSIGWLSRSAIMGEGHYFSLVHSSQNDLSFEQKYPSFATVNFGWLWQHGGEITYTVAAGAGMKYEVTGSADGGQFFNAGLFFNLEANIGIGLLTRPLKVLP